MKKFTLQNGIQLPAIGFGTYKLVEGELCVNSVLFALKNGYRHIDTASIYANETSVGKAIQLANIPREELFITTKIWNTKRGYKEAIQSYEDSLERLGLPFVDLLLIHWPANTLQFGDEANSINQNTWRALEDLYKAGKIKSIGVSNYLKHHLEDLIANSSIVPMVNQIEFHPGYTQQETVDFCHANNIIVEAWSPLGRGRVLEHPTIVSLSKKYAVSPGAICLQFALQQGIVVLPKSATEERIIANLTSNFEFTKEDFLAIQQMPETGFSNLHPDKIDF